MNIGNFVTLKDERGRSHNAKVIKAHSDKLLNLQISHRDGHIQLYNRISKTPNIPLSHIPYWDKQNKPNTVKVVKSDSIPKNKTRTDNQTL